MRDGDRSNAIHQIESTPDLAKSTTYLDKKNALHLAAEEGHLVVLNAVLEVLTCQESIRNTAEGGGDAAESIHSILNAQVRVRLGFPLLLRLHGRHGLAAWGVGQGMAACMPLHGHAGPW